MTDEIYDIYNDQGQKVGTASWSEVHTQELLHHTSALLIFRDASKKEVLLQKRSDKMDQCPGLYQHSAGGHILTGETPEEGMQKEVQEELFGDHPMPEIKMQKLGELEIRDLPGNHEILHLYEAIYPGPFFHNEKEVGATPEWVEWTKVLEDVKKSPQNYTPSFRSILEFLSRFTLDYKSS
jgi:isopentenyl-diphosphate delta-isomerase